VSIGSVSIPREANANEIKAHLAGCGQAVAVRILDDNNGNSKGVAFVQFASVGEAGKACQMDGGKFGTRKLRINLANSRQ
jgi:RNA recognition motif-containing protein